MKKISLLTMLFFSLILNGCIEKSIITQSSPISTARTSIPTTPPPLPPKRVIATSTAGEYHQLQTVQGTTLAIQERSNGFDFPQFRNKIVLLQIFGQECPYCFKEMPTINRIKRKYSKNLQLIALQAQEPMSKQTSSRIIQKFQMNYPIIDKEEARNILYFIQNTYGWTGILPYMLLIKNGVTEYSFSGEVSHQELDEAVRSLI